MSWITPHRPPSPITNFNRILFHVDMNSYFATILQQENPSLRDKPVGVLKSEGRSCVIAASKEAKKLGIYTGESVKEARRKAPNLILVPAVFEVYLDCTHRLKKLFHRLSPRVDIFSLDEAFLDLTGCEALFPSQVSNPLLSYAQYVQGEIKKELGSWVTCNIGIASNKLLSKLASEIAPKGTVLEIDNRNKDAILSQAHFSSVCGIGYRLEKKLRSLGINNPYAINFVDDQQLESLVGPFWAVELKKIANGQETHFFTHPSKVEYAQSVGRTITGFGLTNDEAVIKKVLLNLLEEATRKLRQMNLSGQSIGLSLSGKEQYWGKMMRLKYYVRHTNEIFSLLYDGMYKQWERSFPILKFGVWIGGTKPINETPGSLLPEWERNEKIYESIDAINSRFGLFTVKPATLLGKGLIKPEVTGFLGDKKFHGL